MHCLVCGNGMSMLIYYCATGYRPIEAINGGERGSRIEYINEIPYDIIKKLQKQEVFLDNTTGDFYEFIEVSYYTGYQRMASKRKCWNALHKII